MRIAINIISIIVGSLYANTFICSQAFVDTIKWYHDFEVDYFPRILHCHKIKDIGFSDDNGSAFKESLERSIESCTGEKFVLSRFSGLSMSTAGVEPKEMKEKPSLYLHIFASGAIYHLVVRNLDNYVELETCMKLTFGNCKVLPALKNGQPIKSSWSFTMYKE
jgi:hypothetical protein